eukprot:s480_g3.t1
MELDPKDLELEEACHFQDHVGHYGQDQVRRTRRQCLQKVADKGSWSRSRLCEMRFLLLLAFCDLIHALRSSTSRKGTFRHLRGCLCSLSMSGSGASLSFGGIQGIHCKEVALNACDSCAQKAWIEGALGNRK